MWTVGLIEQIVLNNNPKGLQSSVLPCHLPTEAENRVRFDRKELLEEKYRQTSLARAPTSGQNKLKVGFKLSIKKYRQIDGKKPGGHKTLSSRGN